MSKYFISVVPFTKIPLSREQFFYYSYPEKISKGSLVRISLGKRKLNGIVIESKPEDRTIRYKLKEVESIVEENFLTQTQIELAKFISNYYFASLGIVLKLFVPNRTKERKSTKHTAHGTQQKKEVTLTKPQTDALEKIIESGNQSARFMLQGKSSSGKTEILIQACRKITLHKNSSQALILVPEITHIPSLLNRIYQIFNEEEVAVIHSKISKGKFFSNWEKIKSGNAKVIIGTRQALFTPFKNLKLVTLDESHDISYKQWDMSPRYDARKTAEKLADICKANLVFSTATLRVEDYYATQEKEFHLVKIPPYKKRNVNCEIVDMKKERWDKNYSIISRKLKGEIEWTLKNKMQIILFINKQGISAFSVCKSCKTLLSCPKCERALVYQKSGDYKCLHCNYKTSIFPTCKKCSGLEFQNIGIGTQKVEREIRKIFSSPTIARADLDSMKTTKAQDKLWKDFAERKLDTLIGTQMITKNWDIANVGLVGVIDADSLLDYPDFLTNEKAFQSLVQAIGRTGRSGSKYAGKAIVQTFNPESFVIKSACENNFKDFYQKEIEEREDLSFPPFYHIIKLVYQDKDKKIVDKEAKKIFEKISKSQTRNIKIYPPQDAFVSNIRGRQRKVIVIKSKKYPGIPAKLKKNLQSLKNGWYVDVDSIGIN